MIQSVRGPIPDDQLGVTYIHEHLYVIPNELPKYEDYTLDDIDRSIAEAISFKNAGGKTIVDLTPINYGRNPQVLKKIAEGAGIHVLFVTGFHKQEFQPKWLSELTNSEIYNFLMNEIENGVTSSHLLPAAMKLGTSLNIITEDELRIIDIEGHVQKDSNIPIITHCDKGTMGLEQLRNLKKAGADLAHVCLSHVDLTEDISYIKAICETGASISFDHIGRHLEDGDRLRVKMLTELVRDGYGDRICLAGDMGRKKYFQSYNGAPGLKYILTDLKHALLETLSESDFQKMVKDNPMRILSMQKA